MKTTLTILFAILLLPAMAQYRIAGTVSENSGAPIIGANVYLQGSYDGGSTDTLGYFSFTTSLSGTQRLIISYIGYREFSQEISLSGDLTSMEIELAESVTTMNEVVIAAGSFEAGGESKREVLQPMDIVTTAGATADLAAVLNTLPGTQTVGEQGRVFVRGGDGRETRTFIDGIAVLNEYSPSAPNTPSRSRFLPFMFKGISFSTGGYSAEYGQALSSALILNSKDESVTSRADLSLMSVGMDAAYTHAWEKASATAKIQYTNLTPYFNLVPQSMEWLEAPRSIEGAFAFRSRVNGNGMLKVYGNLNQSQFAYNEIPIEDPDVKVPVDLVNNYRYINVSYKNTISENWFLNTGASFSGNKDDLKIADSPFQRSTQTWHAKATLEHDMSDRIIVRFGTETFLPNAIEQTADTILYTREFSSGVFGVYAEADFRISSFAALRAGSRFEKIQFQPEPYLVPRLSLSFKTGENSQINAAYGQFHQVPQMQFLFANSRLLQERADHYMLSYQLTGKGRTFRIETYQKQYKDLVLVNQQGITNNGNGYARGADLFWRDSKSVSNLDYWVSYSFLDTERFYEEFFTSASPSFSSKHNASFVSKFFVSSIRTQFGFTYSFASGRPYTDPNKGGLQDQLTPAYHDLSANASFLIKPNIILHGSVSNLLGTQNIFGYEYATTPDSTGQYQGRAITLPAPRFAFLGLFVTLSKDNKINQLPNL